jgi:hypothetical protein
MAGKPFVWHRSNSLPCIIFWWINVTGFRGINTVYDKRQKKTENRWNGWIGIIRTLLISKWKQCMCWGHKGRTSAHLLETGKNVHRKSVANPALKKMGFYCLQKNWIQKYRIYHDAVGWRFKTQDGINCHVNYWRIPRPQRWLGKKKTWNLLQYKGAAVDFTVAAGANVQSACKHMKILLSRCLKVEI